MSALTINAWLEREKPVITLVSSLSGNTIAEWRDSAVATLIEDGTVTLSELCSDSQKVQQQTAHELLLTACATSLCARRGNNCFSCITGRLLASYMSTITTLQCAAETPPPIKRVAG
ncbi:hypothetical protein [Amphritea sp. HPY]|uniref:hypothetical protein n=1 Tax=Amphritea sp. HPY TaxID=3421652 RepID=UPI003D7EDD6C